MNPVLEEWKEVMEEYRLKFRHHPPAEFFNRLQHTAEETRLMREAIATGVEIAE